MTISLLKIIGWSIFKSIIRLLFCRKYFLLTISPQIHSELMMFSLQCIIVLVGSVFQETNPLKHRMSFQNSTFQASNNPSQLPLMTVCLGGGGITQGWVHNINCLKIKYCTFEFFIFVLRKAETQLHVCKEIIAQFCPGHEEPGFSNSCRQQKSFSFWVVLIPTTTWSSPCFCTFCRLQSLLHIS